MDEAAEKESLRWILQYLREVLVWKLDGLGEYDVRRPMTPTGTNLLGLVKHCAGVEAGYFGEVLGRPSPAEELDWHEGDAEELSGGLYATADESREQVVAYYRRVWVHSDATIEALPLDTRGTVPWWGEDQRNPTLHKILVHVVQETGRHAGHADVLRELIDGSFGLSDRVRYPVADAGDEAWRRHRDKLERIAREAHGGQP